MSKHTLGPWHIIVSEWDFNTPYHGSLWEICEDKTKYFAPIAEVQERENVLEQRANAQLIAAAPELLETAKKVLENHQRQNDLNYEDYDNALFALKKAVAKAEGR